jgi:hypothetical protein
MLFSHQHLLQFDVVNASSRDGAVGAEESRSEEMKMRFSSNIVFDE